MISYFPIVIRHLCFTGPGKTNAVIEFANGLNVIFGASETGKSFILEAIDFMFGAGHPLRDIPERVGYDRIFLGLEFSGDRTFTLVRATTGGQFQLYDGLHQSIPVQEPTVLKERHSAKNDENISAFLLRRIGLAEKKVRSKLSKADNLSFRNVSRFCLVNEGDIQKQGSPIESGQVVSKTREYSVFKLLLTGVDDSAFISPPVISSIEDSNAAKLEMMDELIASYKVHLGNVAPDKEVIEAQIIEIDEKLRSMKRELQTSEEKYQGVLSHRNLLRQKLQIGLERRSEIQELLARFELLNSHYESDLARLEGIKEAGSLVAALSNQSCPLCGSEPCKQHIDKECDGNIEVTLAAASAEIEKVVQLQRELEETMSHLKSEGVSFERKIPQLRESLNDANRVFQEMAPVLAGQQSTYSELLEKRVILNNALTFSKQISDLQIKRAVFASKTSKKAEPSAETTDLSTTTLDQFSQQVEGLLKKWHFPDADRVHFDQKDKDLVITGKRRGSRGKGMRAITHAAFSVALMEYCKKNKKPHPGFLVLDSPLLAYREPEGKEDDLRGTDVQDKFYEYLASQTDRQIIVIENTDPPLEITKRPYSYMFSKNVQMGRYGYFPHNVDEGG